MRVDVSGLKRLGIDEIALRKGQKEFAVVLVDLTQRKLIGMVASRTHVAMDKVVKAWGEEVLAQIEEVSMDLSGNYRAYVAKRMPNAQVVADRFHVMQQVNQELNQLRNQEIRKLETQLEPEPREEITKLLKSSKYALLKPEANLTDKQKVKLAQVKQISPLLATLHQKKEDLREIFETAQTWQDGMEQFAEWIVSVEALFPKSAATLTNWFDEITNYFHHHTSNGIVEGINNKLKLIKRSGFGFRNFANFELRCLICWHLDFSPA